MPMTKRHTDTEIAAKLAEADTLAAEGKLQSKIAHALGVSVMTLHRWRKIALTTAAATEVINQPIQSGQGNNENNRIAELELENSRLRKLVTDFLLETMKLKEATQSQTPNGRRQNLRKS
jgi:putative transposase